MSKIRLDQILFDRKLAESKSKAQAMIMAGQVCVEDKVIKYSDSIEFIKNRSLTKEINSLTFRFSVPPLDNDHWTNIKEIGGGRIVGEAVHAIDLACYLFDSLPQSISTNAPIDKIKNKAKDNQVFLNINGEKK